MASVTKTISPQVTGLPMIIRVKLEDFLDDYVKGVYDLVIKDLIIPLLKSENISKSFVEIVQLHYAIESSVGAIIFTRYKPTELTEILVRTYEKCQKALVKLEPYLKEATVSALAGLDAQFEYSLGFLELLQKNPEHIMKLQLQQYLELASCAVYLNLCLSSMISVAEGKVKIGEIKKQNLRILALWCESYAAQLMIKAQKMNITDGNRLNRILGREKAISNLLKELQE